MRPLRFIALTMVLVAAVATSAFVSAPGEGEVIEGRAPTRAVPTLESADPFRLVVGSGAPQTITIRGTNFENAGHPNRDEYMHWQIRRDDGPWERCGRLVLNASAPCSTTGWSHNVETLQIGGSHVARAGYIELRVFQGLALETETDPRNAPNPTEWSNVLRIPVVVPGPAPVITALTPTSFPLAADAAAYRLVINASGLDPSAVVVFRGDVVVAPDGMSPGAVHVTVPEKYRLATAGELPLTVRTDRGGHSAPKYIRFAAQSAPATSIAVAKAPVVGEPARAAGSVTPAAVRGAATATVRRSDACVAGFVWREATPQDRTCVTPEARTRAARQNAEAASRRIADPPASGPAPCRAGFVWREAVAGDAVCVTPAERTQTAEDNRLAPSRVVP